MDAQRIVVRCGRCGTEVGAEDVPAGASPEDVGLVAWRLLLAAHTMGHRGDHPLELACPVAPESPAVRVTARCVVCTRHGEGNALLLAPTVPRWRVACDLLVFHSHHEGHPSEVWVDGTPLHPGPAGVEPREG